MPRMMPCGSCGGGSGAGFAAASSMARKRFGGGVTAACVAVPGVVGRDALRSRLPVAAMSHCSSVARSVVVSGVMIRLVEVDEAGETATRFNVMNIPTLIIFKDGKEANRIVGVTPKEELAKKLDALLKCTPLATAVQGLG